MTATQAVALIVAGTTIGILIARLEDWASRRQSAAPDRGVTANG